MNETESGLVVTAVVADGSRTYTLHEAASQCALHPDLLRHYCQLGLLGPHYRDEATEGPFDDTAMYWVRRIERVRRQYGLDRAVLPLVCSLWHEIERLQGELQSLRAR